MAKDKLTLILASGDLERLQAAAMIASVAAVSDTEVDIFVTMEALRSFRRDVVEKGDFPSGPLGKELIRKNAPSFVDLLQQGRELGGLKIWACSMVIDLLGWKREELLDIFEDVIGVSAFLTKAEGSRMLFV